MSELTSNEVHDAEDVVLSKKRARFTGLRLLWRGAVWGFKTAAYPAILLASAAIGSTLGVACLTGVFEVGHSLVRFLFWTFYIGLVTGPLLFAPLGALLYWGASGLRSLFPGKSRSEHPAEPTWFGDWRRTARWTAGLSLAIALTAFGAGAFLAWKVEHRWRAVAAESDAVDPSWRLDRLLADREIVPDEENGARVVARAVSLVEMPDSWLASNTLVRQELRWKDDAVLKAVDRVNNSVECVRLDDESAEILSVELEKFREVVEIARTLANFDRGRTEMDIALTVFDTLLPHLEKTRSVVRFLWVDAVLRSHNGDIDGAIESCLAILGAARSIGDEPFLISQLVRSAVDGVAVSAIQRTLGQGEASDEALARLQKVVLDEFLKPVIDYGVRGERAMLAEFTRRQGDGRLKETNYDLNELEIPAPWLKIWCDYQAVVVLERMNALVAIPSEPAFEHLQGVAVWEPLLVNQVGASRVRQVLLSIPYRMTPAISSQALMMHQRKGTLGATVILLAAERHRRATGDWPKSIDDIAPAILPKPPLDPFTDESFQMRYDGGQLRIYSIGADQVDDDGEDEPSLWGKGGPDDVGANGWDVDLRSLPVEREEAGATTDDSAAP